MTKTERVNPFKEDDAKGEESKFLMDIKEKSTGLICPTCGRKAKEYKRKLTPNLCLALIEVLKYYRHSTEVQSELDFLHINDVFPSKNNPLRIDFSKLLYWDLIEAKGRLVKDKVVKTYGYYRISENGIKFAQREIALPITAIVYNNHVQGHISHPYGTIDQILADGGYDYDEVIKPTTIIQ